MICKSQSTMNITTKLNIFYQIEKEQRLRQYITCLRNAPYILIDIRFLKKINLLKTSKVCGRLQFGWTSFNRDIAMMMADDSHVSADDNADDNPLIYKWMHYLNCHWSYSRYSRLFCPCREFGGFHSFTWIRKVISYIASSLSLPSSFSGNRSCQS